MNGNLRDTLEGIVRELRSDDEGARLRLGTVVSSQGATITVTIGGSTVSVPGVVPVGPATVGQAVWILQQGPLLLALGTPLASSGKVADSNLLDGLDSNDFSRRGRVATGIAGGESTVANITSLNAHLTTGVYDGSNMVGAPTVDWYLVHVLTHNNPSNGTTYQRQVAYQMTGGVGGSAGNPKAHTRSTDGGDPTVASSWTPWRQIVLAGAAAHAGDIQTTSYLRAWGGTTFDTRIGELNNIGAGIYTPNAPQWFYTEQGRGWEWRVGNAQRMTLDGGGRLTVGFDRNVVGNDSWTVSVAEMRDLGAPRIAFHQPGQVASSFGQLHDSEDYVLRDNGGGGFRAITASAFFNGSALKYKTDVKPFARDRRVLDLKPIKYRLIENPLVDPPEWDEKLQGAKPKDYKRLPLKGSRKMRDDDTDVGFDAAEVHKVFPHLVQLDEQGLPDAVNYVGLIPMLLAEIQALRTELDAVTKRLPLLATD